MFKLVLFLLLSIFELQAFADVLVPTRSIKKGEVINQEDFSFMPSNNSNRGCISTVEFDRNIVRAGKNLEPGRCIKKNDVYIDSAIVHKGERVIAKFARKNLSIEIPCIALANGSPNETIKVKGLDSNKILAGKVMEDGSILIE